MAFLKYFFIADRRGLVVRPGFESQTSRNELPVHRMHVLVSTAKSKRSSPVKKNKL